MTLSIALRLADVEESLSHYASKYYDPVKAHEYYERTKKLKGQSSASPNTSAQRQREGVAYAKNQIGSARDADLTSAAKGQEAKLKEIQAKALAARDKILEKLEARVEELRAQAEGIKTNSISRTSSEKLKNFLEKQNQYRKNKALAAANKEAQAAAEEAQAEITKIGNELKEAVTKARESYAASRKAMIERYNTDLKTEVTNIQNQVR